jgi:hypothetical protein
MFAPPESVAISTVTLPALVPIPVSVIDNDLALLSWCQTPTADPPVAAAPLLYVNRIQKPAPMPTVGALVCQLNGTSAALLLVVVPSPSVSKMIEHVASVGLSSNADALGAGIGLMTPALPELASSIIGMPLTTNRSR